MIALGDSKLPTVSCPDNREDVVIGNFGSANDARQPVFREGHARSSPFSRWICTEQPLFAMAMHAAESPLILPKSGMYPGLQMDDFVSSQHRDVEQSASEPRHSNWKPVWVRIPEATRLSGLGRSSIYELIAAGKIRSASSRDDGMQREVSASCPSIHSVRSLSLKGINRIAKFMKITSFPVRRRRPRRSIHRQDLHF